MLTRDPARPGRTSLLLLLLMAAAGFGAGAATVWMTRVVPQAPTGDAPEPEEPGQLVALGRLRPVRGPLTVVGPPGDQIAEIFVKEGQTVEENTVLVRLASSVDREAAHQMDRQQAENAERQKTLAVQVAKNDVALARAKRDEVLAVTPKELEAQQQRLNFLRDQRDTAAQRLQRMAKLGSGGGGGTVPRQEIESMELAHKQAEAELKTGEVLLEKARTAFENGKQLAALTLKAAEDNLVRIEQDPAPALARQKAQLSKLQLDRTELKAPWRGRILKVSGVQGEATGPPQPILQMGDVDPMLVVAEVYETDVNTLRAWCRAGPVKVVVKSPALPKPPAPPGQAARPEPGELAGGQLDPAKIGTVISRNAVFDIDPTADADRRVFEVPVTLTGADAREAAQFVNLQVQVFFAKPAAAGRPAAPGG